MPHFGTKHFRKKLKVSFPTHFRVPILLVIPLRPIEFKKMHLDQCGGQIMQTKGGERCKKVVYFQNNNSNDKVNNDVNNNNNNANNNTY